MPKSPPCAYCGESSNHKDHVIPQTIFSKWDDKTQMVTVRACQACKIKKDPLDSFLRDFLASDLRTDKHPNAMSKFWGETRRSALRKQSEISRIIATQSVAREHFTPAGIYLGDTFEADVSPWINVEFEFFARGLTRYHNRAWTVSPDAVVNSIILDDVQAVEVWRAMESRGGVNGPWVRGNEVFRWAFEYANADNSNWLMCLWGRLPVFVSVSLSQQPTKQD